MARDPLNRAFAPTSPDDALDPPRFSQITETVKDVFVLELRKFFANAQHTAERRFELPTVEKYATFGDGNDPFSTSVEILRKFPDRLEALPHVAVMAAGGTQKSLTIGTPYMATVQDPPYVQATEAEPYALADGDTLVIRVKLSNKVEYEDRITFRAERFPALSPITAALASDVARVINEYACHCHASVVEVGDDQFLRIEAGGPESIKMGRTPFELEIQRESSAAETLGLGRSGTITHIYGPEGQSATLVETLAGAWSEDDVGNYLIILGSENTYFNDGRFPIESFSEDGGTETLGIRNKYTREELNSPATWFIGARDSHTNSSRPPKHRYAVAFEVSTQIDILTEDENTRGEILDLVLGFFTFFLESKFFTFMGRSGFEGQEAVTNEHYQIVINPPVRNAQESEMPRPSGDATNKIYVNSLSVEVTISMYLDRELYWPGTSTTLIVRENTHVEDPTLIT